MSSSEDNSSTGLPITNQPIISENLDSSSSSFSEENENEQKKEKESWIYMIQPERHGDYIHALNTYYNRARTGYKELKLNEIYVSKAQMQIAYNLKRKEVKHPFTVFGIVTKEFRLLFSEKEKQVIYTDQKGTYLSHSDLHLRRYKVVWLTSNTLLLNFVYAHKKHAAIEFQIIMEARVDHFYVRSKQVILHYEELELPQLISKTAYPSRIRNWYLLFE